MSFVVGADGREDVGRRSVSGCGVVGLVSLW